MRHALVLLGSLALGACHLVSGLEAFEVEAATAAGAAGTAGGGGAAGGATSTGGAPDGAGGTASSGGEGGEAPECVAAFPCPDQAPVDTFHDGVLASEWDPQLFNDITAEEANGRLRFSVPPGSEPRYGSLWTAEPHDLEGCGVIVEYRPAGSLKPGESAHLLARLDDSNRAGFILNGASLTLHEREEGRSSYPQIDFDPSLHRWWWLRVAEGAISWLTSPDGHCFTEQHSRPNFLPAALVVSVGAGTQEATDGFNAVFDNLNAPPAP